ncbi:MAG: zinc ribbon domain-containing protein [Bacillota bacterium]|nr:zinc ribbon domain-containing protein [Bacillota bacterium]
MSGSKKTIIRVILIIVLVCFFLPFVTVSCSGKPVETFSGLNLVFGGKYHIADNLGLGDMGSSGTSSGYGPQFFVLLAFLAGIVALAVTFMKKGKSLLLSGVMAVLGLISTILSTINISGQSKSESSELGSVLSGSLLQVRYNIGFYLILLGFAGTAAYIFYSIYSKPVTNIRADNPVYINQDPPRFCSNCGSSVTPGNDFCVNCGQKIE